MMSAENEAPPFKDLKPIADFRDMLGGATTQTIHTWIKYGARKGTVKLRAWMLTRWHTTEAEVLDFIQRKTESALTIAESPATTAAMRRQGEEALRLFNAKCKRKK